MAQRKLFGKREASLPSPGAFAKMPGVGTEISQIRMTETLTGRVAAFLLLAVWLVAMGVGDANAYSYIPMCSGLAVVLLLFLSVMIRGAKVVRISPTGWCSLAVGCYFLVRCLCSVSVVESWRESAVIAGCCVFYVAGIYAAQSRSLRMGAGCLALAVAVNLFYFGLMNGTDIPMEWSGRPSVGLSGQNTRPLSLFIYKNYAGAFFAIAGMMLAAAAMWGGKGRFKFFLFALSAASAAASCCCSTRGPYLLLPAAAVLVGGLTPVVYLYAEEKRNRRLSVLCLVLLLAGGGAGCCVLSDSISFAALTEADSHERFALWANVCRLLPDAPWCGYGALATRWLVLPLQTSLNCCPNYAHNEYLQAWADYGFVGVLCQFALVGWHLLRGGFVLMSEQTPFRQRVMTAVSVLGLVCWSVASFFDFYWHNFAIAGMTAFAMGCLASPYPVVKDGGRVRRKVLLERPWGKAVLALGSVCLIALCSLTVWRCAPAWAAQWEYNRLSAEGTDESGDARHALLADIMPQYPASELMDEYFAVPRSSDTWETEARLLRLALAANPRQLYTATMLCELLGTHDCCQEAEILFRRHYTGNGMDETHLADWPNLYALNLLRWGQSEMMKGNMPAARSMMEYGLAIVNAQGSRCAFDRLYRPGKHPWEIDRHFQPKWPSFLHARRQDVKLLRLLGVAPDHSWAAPLEPGGKPSLYRRWAPAEKPENKPLGGETQPMPAAQ